MTKTQKRWVATVAVVLAVWLFASPYVTLYRLQMAVQARDADTVSSMIDYPSVRESLKASWNVAMAKGLSSNAEIKDNPFAAAGAALAGTMMNGIVDGLVTPEALQAAFSGNAPQAQANNVREYTGLVERPQGVDFHYVSFDRFAVDLTQDTTHAQARLCRSNLISWKLCAVNVTAQ